MKRFLFIFLIFESIYFTAQTKREQIEILKFRVDSLNTKLLSEGFSNSKEKYELDSVIFNLERELINEDCWKDTLILENKNLLIYPISSSEFNSVSHTTAENNKKIDKNIQSNKLFIKCTFRNGLSKTYRNNHSKDAYGNTTDQYLNYSVVSLETIDYYFMDIQLYEGPDDYLLIDKENGNEIPIGSEPFFSNNKKHFACGFMNCYGGNSGEFQIFDVKENGKVKLIETKFNFDWQPFQLKWNFKNELLIEKGKCGCDQNKYGKLIIK